MKICHSFSYIPKSIFLAGPTPRDPSVKSWRPKAIDILNELNFQGTVFVPECEDWTVHGDYDDQVHWEWEAINSATVVCFWIPRDLDILPAFTTNIEFGYLIASGKIVLGYPTDSPKNKYIDKLAKRHNIKAYHSLTSTVSAAITKTDLIFTN
jgi:nucleoside 2-deoxyribosyltransferase